MATKREMVSTIPSFAVQHKASALPVAVGNTSSQGKTQYGTHSHPIHSGPWGKHQTHMYQVWNANLLHRKQYTQTNTGKAQLQGPKRKGKWGSIQLPVWSH